MKYILGILFLTFIQSDSWANEYDISSRSFQPENLSQYALDMTTELMKTVAGAAALKCYNDKYPPEKQLIEYNPEMSSTAQFDNVEEDTGKITLNPLKNPVWLLLAYEHEMFHGCLSGKSEQESMFTFFPPMEAPCVIFNKKPSDECTTYNRKSAQALTAYQQLVLIEEMSAYYQMAPIFRELKLSPGFIEKYQISEDEISEVNHRISNIESSVESGRFPLETLKLYLKIGTNYTVGSFVKIGTDGNPIMQKNEWVFREDFQQRLLKEGFVRP